MYEIIDRITSTKPQQILYCENGEVRGTVHDIKGCSFITFGAEDGHFIRHANYSIPSWNIDIKKVDWEEKKMDRDDSGDFISQPYQLDLTIRRQDEVIEKSGKFKFVIQMLGPKCPIISFTSV